MKVNLLSLLSTLMQRRCPLKHCVRKNERNIGKLDKQQCHECFLFGPGRVLRKLRVFVDYNLLCSDWLQSLSQSCRHLHYVSKPKDTDKYFKFSDLSFIADSCSLSCGSTIVDNKRIVGFATVIMQSLRVHRTFICSESMALLKTILMLQMLCFIAQASCSCLNPTVYAFLRPEFRKNCFKYCCCCFPRCSFIRGRYHYHKKSNATCSLNWS